MRAIIDSDVLIDYLQGLDKAKREIERYSQREISIPAKDPGVRIPYSVA